MRAFLADTMNLVAALCKLPCCTEQPVCCSRSWF